MDIRWAEVRVGVFLMVALVVLGLGIFLIGEQSRIFTRSTTVRVLLTEVQGLKVGAPVWLSGVVIGTVAEISFAEPLRSDEITVTLRIEEDAARRLGSDARVSVRTRGLLGEKYVDITPGTEFGLPSEPLRGAPPMDIDHMVERAYETFERLGQLVEDVGGPQSSFGKLLRDPTLYDSLVQLTQRLRKLADEISEGEGSMARIIKDPRLYEKMTAFSARGEEAVTRLNELTAALQDPNGTLALLAHDPTLYNEGVETVRRAQKSMAELDALLAKIGEGEGTAGRLINDDELHVRLNRTLEDLDALVRDMKKNPGRYVKFSLF
jgi:phospholipid/cholesterol/gamma-HCH transport system substrate-binding protein